MFENYDITDSIAEATHWLSGEDEYNVMISIIPGKFYKLIYDEEEDEFFVTDEDGILSMAYMAIKGDFVIITE